MQHSPGELRCSCSFAGRRHPLHRVLQITDRLRQQFADFLTAQLEEDGIRVDDARLEDNVADAMQVCPHATGMDCAAAWPG